MDKSSSGACKGLAAKQILPQNGLEKQTIMPQQRNHQV
jgi:hypothetical protein